MATIAEIVVTEEIVIITEEVVATGDITGLRLVEVTATSAGGGVAANLSRCGQCSISFALSAA
jgi:hypothetical protein